MPTKENGMLKFCIREFLHSCKMDYFRTERKYGYEVEKEIVYSYDGKSEGKHGNEVTEAVIDLDRFEIKSKIRRSVISFAFCMEGN